MKPSTHPGAPMMSFRFPAILSGLTLLISLTGCTISVESRYTLLSPPVYDPHQPASIIDLSANYCRSLAKNQGVDFSTCFKQQTDFAIKQMQEQRAASPNVVR
jgi:hypothetical protein